MDPLIAHEFTVAASILEKQFAKIAIELCPSVEGILKYLVAKGLTSLYEDPTTIEDILTGFNLTEALVPLESGSLQKALKVLWSQIGDMFVQVNKNDDLDMLLQNLLNSTPITKPLHGESISVDHILKLWRVVTSCRRLKLLHSR